MKKMSELMEEMGFREEASTSAKEAFLKNLIKQAVGVEVQTPSEKNTKKIEQWCEQLSFDFNQNTGTKKVG